MSLQCPTTRHTMSDADDIEEQDEEPTLPARRTPRTSARQEPDQSDDEFGIYDEEDFLVEEALSEQQRLPSKRRFDAGEGCEDRGEPVKKSRHRIHVVKATRELATTYEYGTQAPEPDSSPTTFRGPRWKIPKDVATSKPTARFVFSVLAFAISIRFRVFSYCSAASVLLEHCTGLTKHRNHRAMPILYASALLSRPQPL